MTATGLYGTIGYLTTRSAGCLKIENQAHSFLYGGDVLCRETADAFRQIRFVDSDDL